MHHVGGQGETPNAGLKVNTAHATGVCYGMKHAFYNRSDNPESEAGSFRLQLSANGICYGLKTPFSLLQVTPSSERPLGAEEQPQVIKVHQKRETRPIILTMEWCTYSAADSFILSCPPLAFCCQGNWPLDRAFDDHRIELRDAFPGDTMAALTPAIPPTMQL